MFPSQRILTSLASQEPNHFPLDIRGTHVTGINVGATRNFLSYSKYFHAAGSKSG